MIIQLKIRNSPYTLLNGNLYYIFEHPWYNVSLWLCLKLPSLEFTPRIFWCRQLWSQLVIRVCTNKYSCTQISAMRLVFQTVSTNSARHITVVLLLEYHAAVAFWERAAGVYCDRVSRPNCSFLLWYSITATLQFSLVIQYQSHTAVVSCDIVSQQHCSFLLWYSITATLQLSLVIEYHSHTAVVSCDRVSRPHCSCLLW